MSAPYRVYVFEVLKQQIISTFDVLILLELRDNPESCFSESYTVHTKLDYNIFFMSVHTVGAIIYVTLAQYT